MTPQEEARRMIEPRMETRYSRAKLCDEYVLTIDTAITLLASQIERVRELENSLAEQLKTGEALMVEKNERITALQNQLETIQGKIEGELKDAQFVLEGYQKFAKLEAIERQQEYCDGLQDALSCFPTRKEKEG